MAKLIKIHLLTGANLGDRFGTLLEANRLIEEKIGHIEKTSSFYETEAWGNVDQPAYLNQALEVATALPPGAILSAIFEIEEHLGRVRRSKWESRPIDIDILFYEDKILNTKDLTIPHRHLHRRNFVLVPMLEIAPDKLHPVLKKTIEELYDQTEDTLDVMLIEPLTTETPAG